MKVLVTGASGFVGSHTVKALVGAGHHVRASARTGERVRRALAPLGCADTVEITEADILDKDRIDDALNGCDAVVHAAATYSHDVRRSKEMLTTNPRGTELVLGRASELGLDPVIHVSTYTALLPARETLKPYSPVGNPPTPYARSKARSEHIARRLQAEGAPVTIVYPGMVWGPNDPQAGESTLLARDVLEGRIPFGAPGRVGVVDVRDVAAVHAAALRPGVGPQRYIAASEVVPTATMMRIVAETGGRRPPRGVVPAPLVLGLARVADAVQRISPKRLPLDYQSPWTALNFDSIDASATVRELGVGFRTAEDSIADTVRWLNAGDRAAGPVE
ncbi:SDR family NAD(P)-dependent oxidoreductase [Allosalinactinospora lopnorensis]|uniref:SDR family NAD(P)-dependent oxidoreductase n=1 Tax=Allosalinactinospora lopnorensis TaxID=1352348 RepID=UPI000623C452|nr:SDR family NAD(P)-dependent oxidoreductase [Allosalinactinospora lopnorensis]